MFRVFVLLLAISFLICGCSINNSESSATNDPVKLEMGNSAQVLSLLETYSEPDDSGNLSSIAESTLEGEWIKNEIFADDGTFDGIWYDKDGGPISYCDGMFWTTDNGYQLFSGTLSGYYTDELQGYLFGRWFYDDYRMCPMCGEGHGQFKGFFIRLNDQGMGVIRGEFGDYSLPFDELVLPMSGVWKMYNPELIINGYNVEDASSN